MMKYQYNFYVIICLVIINHLVSGQDKISGVRSLLSSRSIPSAPALSLVFDEFNPTAGSGVVTEETADAAATDETPPPPSRLEIAEKAKTAAINFLQRNAMRSDELSQVDYLLIGDWGGKKGKATPQYLNTLTSMREYIKILFCSDNDKFTLLGILNVGDNFYDHGINSLHDDFLYSVYKVPFLERLSGIIECPSGKTFDLSTIGMYGVLGNHDHLTNPSGGWRYQIELTAAEYSEEINYPQWMIPDLWFAKELRFQDKVILFIFYDTMILERHLYDELGYQTIQQRWFMQMLDKYTNIVDHVFMVGHHPPFCTAKHNGNDKVLEEIINVIRAFPYYRRRITFLGGHDHTFEGGYATDDDIVFLHNFVIGGTRDCDPHGYWIADWWKGRKTIHWKHLQSPIHQSYANNVWYGCDGGGFAHLSLKSSAMPQHIDVTVSFYSGTGAQIHSGTFRTPMRFISTINGTASDVDDACGDTSWSMIDRSGQEFVERASDPDPIGLMDSDWRPPPS